MKEKIRIKIFSMVLLLKGVSNKLKYMDQMKRTSSQKLNWFKRYLRPTSSDNIFLWLCGSKALYPRKKRKNHNGKSPNWTTTAHSRLKFISYCPPLTFNYDLNVVFGQTWFGKAPFRNMARDQVHRTNVMSQICAHETNTGFGQTLTRLFRQNFSANPCFRQFWPTKKKKARRVRKG